MPASRDPTPLLRHAAVAGDRRLVALIIARLGPLPGAGAARACAELVCVLNLDRPPPDTDGA